MLSNLMALRQVMRDAKLPRSELDKTVHKRLEAVLVSAYRHVPYYRGLMQSVGYDPIRDYRGPQDLSRLPITTKAVIKQRGTRAFIKEGSEISNCFSDTTSGSTGIPLRIYRTSYERSVQVAKWLRVLFSNGYSMCDKVMSLTSPARLTEGHSIIQRFGILRRLAIDYLLPPEEMVDILLAYRPDVLYGNRSHLDLMALVLKQRQRQPVGLKLLVVAAETVYDSCRQLYCQHFGVEPIEVYGSVEMGVMAYETPAHDGLYLCEDLTYFEFLDRDEKVTASGKPGRVVVTDLTARLMPFIRYDQGDLAVFEYRDNMKDETLRRLTRIIGREDDHVCLPDGTRRPFHDFYEVIDKYQDIVQFRVIQRRRNLFQILIVADTDYFLSIQSGLARQLEDKFPPSVSFESIQVDQIDPDPSGKIRMFVSEVC